MRRAGWSRVAKSDFTTPDRDISLRLHRCRGPVRPPVSGALRTNNLTGLPLRICCLPVTFPSSGRSDRLRSSIAAISLIRERRRWEGASKSRFGEFFDENRQAVVGHFELVIGRQERRRKA